jgi:glutamate/tyrosine decarboxylase-like PLP-dependent enzyme
VDRFIERTPELPVATDVTPEEVRRHLEEYDFSSPRPLEELIGDCARMLTRWSLHVTHPRYFGLFNPSVTFAGVLADTLVAGFNPQVGAWKHNPAGVEIENHVLRYLGGGSEANTTGVLIALASHFPALDRGGLRALPGQPTLYVSADGHDSFEKIARQAGLGRDAVRKGPVDGNYRRRGDELAQMVIADRKLGELPFLVVATAGSTRAGAVDLLPETAALCQTQKLHLHVDAAWGGAAVLSDRLRPLLAGIESADTITFDPHKWLSVPMGCGVILSRDGAALQRTFGVDVDYVPGGGKGEVDLYQNSLQWSRRFIGLKLFLSLAAAGRDGYSRAIEHQAEMGRLLREKLDAGGWHVMSKTELPIVCFADPEVGTDDRAARHYESLVAEIVRRGRAWISTARLAGRPVLRACITSYRTEESDLDTLVEELTTVRSTVAHS